MSHSPTPASPDRDRPRRDHRRGRHTQRTKGTRRRNPARLRALRVATAAMSALALAGVGIGWLAQAGLTSGLYTSDALKALAPDAPRSAHGDTNILLIGLDSRKAMDGSDLPARFVTDKLHAGDSEVGGYNTNTLLLLHVPGDGSRASAAAIPRDDYVNVPGYGMRKVKEAYGLAKADEETRLENTGVTDAAQLEQKSREVGRRSTLTTVQNLLHVPIDHFAEVNLIGFYNIAQALGPLQVCLNAPVHDEFSGSNFPAGRQTLDPSQALSFVRQRHGLDNGDLDRTHRQQAFISAVIQNLRSTGVIGNLGKMQGLVDAAKKDIVIDSGMDPMKFASQATNLTGGDLDFYTLPIEGYATVDGQDVNKVDVTRLRAEVGRLFATGDPTGWPTTTADAPEPSGHETVDVANGTDHAGLAGSAASEMANLGYRTGAVTSSSAVNSTTVRYGTGGDGLARVLADRYGVTATVDSTLASNRVAVTLGPDSIGVDLTPSTTEPTPPTTSAGTGAAGVKPVQAAPTAGPQGAPIAADQGTPCVD